MGGLWAIYCWVVFIGCGGGNDRKRVVIGPYKGGTMVKKKIYMIVLNYALQILSGLNVHLVA